MGKFSFRYLRVEELEQQLPQVFDILYTNMTALAPSGESYQDDRRMWESYIVPALKAGSVQLLLMFAEENLAGYAQYSLRENTLLMDEVEIKPEYQRTMLFYRFCQYMMGMIPEEICYIESYVNKKNQNSLSIHSKLGLTIVGENRSGSSWRMRGEKDLLVSRFNR